MFQNEIQSNIFDFHNDVNTDESAFLVIRSRGVRFLEGRTSEVTT
ncbi:unnamed protein product, partial [Rotaria magnacalcarata]